MPTDTSPGVVDHRKGPRRRGDTLNSAIFEATLDELCEVGYRELTMQGIARRAKASRGSLYRRWSSHAELVVDALTDGRPEPVHPDTGSVRDDILDYLSDAADKLNGPFGEAIRGLMAEMMRDEELMAIVRTRFFEPSTEYMLEALRRGVIRGEVRPTALTPLVAGTGPHLLRMNFMIHGTADQEFITQVVDDILMPLISGPQH
ncbi:TetR/AcrR family transcriptional regulator [Pseudonocardia spinosispora]|uniref:TetR/AcrR family transcriptional regulator n=1 Tax=Pseudonocardia spinosispora TaxID=103441 RepID=UPI000424A31B|nr:TetR/AcrR family transcriptional regulator [Pseudonocardia spinosispora]